MVGGTYTITLTSAQAVEDFLPQGGPPDSLLASYVDPTKKTEAGVLAGQVVTLALNVDFSDAGVTEQTNSSPFGLLVYAETPFDGLTVYELLDLANAVLGGEESLLDAYGASSPS